MNSQIREGAPGTAYVAWARNPEAGFGSSSFDCTLKFNNREWDTLASEFKFNIGRFSVASLYRVLQLLLPLLSTHPRARATL